jgi:hypothetical protein
VIEDQPMLKLDPKCPWCRKVHDVGEIFDGRDTDCASCGKRIVAVAYEPGLNGEPGFMRMEKSYGPGSLGRRPHDRQATRARWQRQGRRGG